MTDIDHIGQLKPDKQNARRHSPRNIGMVEDALNEVGAARSIVIDEDGVILAGNATIEAAAQAGIERVQVVDADGETIVAVRRSGLTPEQKRRLALYDNRTAELAAWDTEVLAEFAALDTAVFDGLFNAEELGELMAGLGDGAPADAEPQIDKAEELREKWGVQPGQLWLLGEHRLMCGDCTDAEVVARVMGGERAALCLTDPPYATGGKSSDYDIQASELSGLIDSFLPIARAVSERVLLTPGNAHQFEYPKPTWVLAWFVTAGVGANPWGFTFWNAVFAYGADPYLERGMGSRPDAFVKTEAAEKTGHPTSKPVGVWEWLIERGSVGAGDIVYDPFLGSGTTLIACERLGRKCRAIEIEPKYVAVAIQRWVDVTGGTPELAGG